MKNGVFIYPSWQDGRAIHAPVRECPNPAVARQALEDMLQRPVKWLEHRA